MDKLFTVLPFLLAFAVAVAAMPTNVFTVNRFEMGTEHAQPWRSKGLTLFDRATAGIRHWLTAASVRLWRHPLRSPALGMAVLLVGALVMTGQPSVLLATTVLAAPGQSMLKQCRQRDADLKADISKLSKERAAVGTAAITEKRPLSEDERGKFLELGTKIDGLKAQLEENAELLAAAESANEAERTFKGIKPDPDEEATARAHERIEVGDDEKAKRAKATGQMGVFGQFLQYVYQAAIPGGSVHQSLKAAATGLNETVPSEGGFLVQQELVSTIRERMYETGDLLSRVNKIPIGPGKNGIKLPAIDETSRANGSRHGGIRAYWTAEAGEKIASKPKFRIINLQLNKLAALVYSTDELLEDSVALEAWIQRALPEELMFVTEDAIVSGTGAGQPLGFLNSGAAISVTRTTANLIQYEDVLNMWSRLYAPSRKNAIWMIDQGAEAQLFSMSLAIGTGGVPVYMPAGGVSGAPHSTLFGRPIITSEYGAALGTVGDFMLIDPSQYTLIDKGGVKSDVSIHVRFIYDESVFRFVYRVDGQPDWNSALTPKSGGNTTSPYVLLAT